MNLILNLDHVCFLKNSFWKITFQTFLCLFTIRKFGQRKTLFGQEKFSLIFKKVFSWKIWTENTFRSYKKIRNVILFADYIKFGPQTFDCYVYFVLNIYFSISSLKI
jgi:hypothetical protein